MKAFILIIAIIVIIWICKRSERKPDRSGSKTSQKTTIKIKLPDPEKQIEKQRTETINKLKYENRYATELLKREKIIRQAERNKLIRYQATQDKINYEIEKKTLIDKSYSARSEKEENKYNKAIRDIDKKIERAAFESIDFNK